MKEYDVIASLGGDCAVSYQLRHRGLRMTSLPFDWTRMTSPKALEYLICGFQNDFEDLCLKENLEFEGREPIVARGGRIEYPALDKLSGFDFIHLFTRPLTDNGAYDEGDAILKRRISRFVSMLEKAKSALLILATEFAYEDQLALALAQAIRHRFPQLKLSLRLMMFHSERQGVIVQENGDCICRYQRKLDLHYDMVFTSYEWKFLDVVKLSSCPLPAQRKPKGLKGLKYKTWKKFGLELEEQGYACCNMRFWNLDKESSANA